MTTTPDSEAAEAAPAPPAPRPRVLLGVTGGIAAYKSAALCSGLVKAGCDVRVIMTDAATRFITPLPLRSLSGAPVLASMWDHDDRPDSQHIGLARWCDAFVIAPASADALARLAYGLTGDLVSLTACALPASTPLVVAPAMNADMWTNPVTRRNLTLLRELLPNLHTVGPATGWQACRTNGPGRMSEPEDIQATVLDLIGH